MSEEEKVKVSLQKFTRKATWKEIALCEVNTFMYVMRGLVEAYPEHHFRIVTTKGEVISYYNAVR